MFFYSTVTGMDASQWLTTSRGRLNKTLTYILHTNDYFMTTKYVSLITFNCNIL